MENSKVKVAVHIAASRYYVNCGDAQSIQIEDDFRNYGSYEIWEEKKLVE